MKDKQPSSMTVGIVLPVFNVEKTIGKVLRSIDQAIAGGVFEILIIDNCSTDETVPIIQEYMIGNPAFASCVTIIQHKENYGYGCSIKGGFDYFTKRDVSHVMVIHGDHQVEPAWLMGRLLGAVKRKPDADLVLASRFKPESSIENYSTLRTLGNYFFNATTTFCSGHKMSDSGTAMILVRNELLKKVPFLGLSNSWQFHPQLNILMYEVPGGRIEEIPMNWEDSDADSTVPLFRYGLILLKMLLLYWFKKNVMRQCPGDIFPDDPIPAHREVTILPKVKCNAAGREADDDGYLDLNSTRVAR